MSKMIKNTFNNSNLKNLKNDLDEVNNVIKNEDLTLFISFDIVNSSKFKSSYSNWFSVIHLITNKIISKIQGIDSNIQLWRSIGDEIIFIINLNSSEKLKRIIQDVFIQLNNIDREIKNGEIFESTEIEINNFEKEALIEQNMLSIKGTAWIALVSNDPYSRDRYKYNIRYEYNTVGATMLTEFQGNDIDSGFRVAKYNTNPRRLTLSLELAYILSKDKAYNPKLHIISYKKLRGIWGGKPYPVIWYHDEYIAQSRLEDSFYYYEDEEQELVKEYKERLIKVKEGKILNCDAHLELSKIINDRNMGKKIINIEACFDEKLPETSKVIDEKKNIAQDTIEVHCVAICITENNKVLMLRRSQNDKLYGGKWEFGCSRMRRGLTFKECLKEDYKFICNADIEVKEPFRDYEFERDNEKISGVRFIASLKNEDEVTINYDQEKYIDFKFIDLEAFDNGDVEPVIDNEDFREIIKIALSNNISEEK